VNLGPAILRWPQRRQAAQPCDPLVQPLQLPPAARAGVQVRPRGLDAGLAAGLPQRHQLFDRQMRHADCSSPSHRRSRSWARASCDFEKLTVLPIIVDISSWV
jgi:hypothetical protein